MKKFIERLGTWRKYNGRVLFAFLNVLRTYKSSFQKEQKRVDISTPSPVANQRTGNVFKSQKIFCPKHEPFSTHVSGQVLLVTTKQCIEVYPLQSEEGCLVINTSGQVTHLLYLSTENLIITLECKSGRSKSTTCSVHLYHISHNATDTPTMHCSQALPVASASCLAADLHSNSVAVGDQKRVRLYRVITGADSGKADACYDLRILLEVNVSFVVTEICLCEEYVLCRGESEVQVFEIQVVAETRRSVISRKNLQDGSALPSGEGGQYISPYLVMGEKSGEATRSHSGHVENDEYHIELSTQPLDQNTGQDGVRSKWLPSVKSAYEDLAHVTREYEVIIGPIQNHPRCAVFYNHIGADVSGCIEKTLLTHLYRGFDQNEVIQIQLTPVYRTHTGDAAQTDHPLYSSDRSDLAVVLCYISTGTEGYLYSIGGGDRTRRLQRYTYTTPMIQFCLSPDHLYVATTAGLEVYTVNSTARAIVKQIDSTATQLFPVQSEPCMVGLQPFLSIQSLSQCADQVVVLSKSVSGGERFWTVYVLQVPGVIALATDMLDLAELHQSSSQGTYEYMLHQIYSLLWSTIYLHRLSNHSSGDPVTDAMESEHDIEKESTSADSVTDSEATAVNKFLQKMALYLGRLHASSANDSVCIPYFLQTQLSLCDVITSCVNNSSNHGDNTGTAPPPTGLCNYVDYVIFELGKNRDIPTSNPNNDSRSEINPGKNTEKGNQSETDASNGTENSTEQCDKDSATETNQWKVTEGTENSKDKCDKDSARETNQWKVTEETENSKDKCDKDSTTETNQWKVTEGTENSIDINNKDSTMESNPRKITEGTENSTGACDISSLMPRGKDSDLILEFYSKWRPQMLSTVLLRSHLTGFNAGHAVELLSHGQRSLLSPDTGTSHTLDTLALTLLYLDLGEQEKAKQAVRSLSESELKKLCSTTDSPPWCRSPTLTRLLCVYHRDALTDILTSQVRAGALSVAGVQTTYPGNYIEVLERLACDFTNRELFPQIGATLCSHYLEKLRSSSRLDAPVRYIIRRRDGLYRARWDWLNHIYPLQGADRLRRVCVGVAECMCTACNAYLLKLQCLLCSDELSDDSLHTISQDPFVTSEKRMQSILLLSLRRCDEARFVASVLELYPGITTLVLVKPWDAEIAREFGVQMLQSQRLVQKGAVKLSKVERKNTKNLLQAVLSILSERLPAVQFLSLLPKDANNTFFLPYVVRCLQIQQADKVQAELRQTKLHCGK